VSAHDRTRALISRHLPRPIGRRDGGGDIYRDATVIPVDGEWVGGFAQAGTILNTITPVSVRFERDGGAMSDVYDESRLTRADHGGDRVAFMKQYASSNGEARFHYIGRLRDGEIAGYWQDPGGPRHAGVFWLTRADRLDDATLADFRRLASNASPASSDRTLLQVSALVLTAGPILAFPSVIGVLAALILDITLLVSVSTRVTDMPGEVAAWRRELGE
jgi:hypothetical protein